MIDINARFTRDKLEEFANELQTISATIGFKVSARGWGYLLENAGFITKDEFDKVEKIVNRCRREGILPVDFVAEEDARAFHGIENPTEETVKSVLSESGVIDPLQELIDSQDEEDNF